MSFFEIVKTHISGFTEDELYSLKKFIEDDISRRVREKLASINDAGIQRFLSVWPNLEISSGKVAVKACADDEVIFTIVPHVAIPTADKPPYTVILTRSELHIELSRNLSSYWFNYALRDGVLHPHWQFKNKSDCPREFLEIPMIRDIIRDPERIFEQLRGEIK